MKLKKTLMLGMALCMAFGVSMTAAACDPNDNQDDITYSITVDVDDTSALSDVKVLFYSDDASKTVSLNGDSANATLPAGDYVAYLTGKLTGYIYTPVALSATKKSATIEAKPATADEDGRVPYQVLVLYPGGDKIYKGDPENEAVQICTSEGQEDAVYGCFLLLFDDMYMARLNMMDEQMYLDAISYDVHFEYSPEGYTFDESQYKISAAGGFISVQMKAA